MVAGTHANGEPAEVIDIRPLGTELKDAQTTTLVKTECLELIRLVLPAGKGSNDTTFQA